MTLSSRLQVSRPADQPRTLFQRLCILEVTRSLLKVMLKIFSKERRLRYDVPISQMGDGRLWVES